MLYAAAAGFLSARGSPTPPEPQRFASWDEVNVLAHGLLQLGHGLREHVERTQGQLGALERRLGACGAACKEPGGSAAPPRAPEGLGPRGEAAPEALRSLQVLGAPLRVLNSVDGRGVGDAPGVPREGELEGRTGG